VTVTKTTCQNVDSRTVTLLVPKCDPRLVVRLDKNLPNEGTAPNASKVAESDSMTTCHPDNRTHLPVRVWKLSLFGLWD